MTQDASSPYRSVTEAYYSAWIGMDDLTKASGVEYVGSPERDVRQTGYSNRFDLFIWIQPERVIVSYGGAAAPLLPALRVKLAAPCAASAIAALLRAEFSLTAAHSVKYCLGRVDHSPITAQTLGPGQYSDYAAFFRACHPMGSTDWLHEYFAEMARRGYCVGVYKGDKLVSCTDAPSMPYLADQAQEIGIHTLPEYRGMGYAAAAGIACAKSILAGGRVPQWSTGIGNVASQKTAARVGFFKLADVLTATLGK